MTRDVAGGLAAILIGAAYLFFASQIRASALDDSVGPGGVPEIYGWLMVSLGAILTVQGVIVRVRAGPGGEEWSGQGRRILWAAGLLLFGIAYLLAVGTVGYLLSIALLLAGVALYQGAGSVPRVAAVGVVGSLALFVLFKVVLGVSLPAGVLAPLLDRAGL